jgi:hypothetical protein
MMAANIPEEEFTSGWLPEETLFVWQRGAKRVVVGYRKAQKTGLWLEGSEDPIRIPMPGLVMVRTTTSNLSPQYSFYAVKDERPSKLSKLFYCPLPHVGRDGSCWGTVRVPDAAALKTNDLSEDWKAFLGSRFGNHTVSGKSATHPNDIRKLFIDLEKKKARVYPRREMIPLDTNLGVVIEGRCK